MGALGGIDAAAPPGELDLSGQHIEDTYLGLPVKNWFDHYLKDTTAARPEFAYFRDWVSYTGSAAARPTPRPAYPAGTPQTWYLSAADALVLVRGGGPARVDQLVQPRRRRTASYSEVSGLEGRVALPPGVTAPFDTPGTFGRWSDPAADASPLDGRRLADADRRLEAPAVAATQAAGPSGQLQVFAKIYDVAPGRHHRRWCTG